jgi:tripartite-type tricarboxylate transporter receptor subunit TctC
VRDPVRAPPGLVLTLIAVGRLAAAADARPTFFEGKTIRIVVGSSPGGGYDLSSRAIAPHLGRHIPGKPAVIVENMTGAGSLVAANYLDKIAKPDGLTFGVFSGMS